MKTTKLLLAFSVLATVSAALSLFTHTPLAQAAAVTWYVATNGSNTNDCTSISTPCQTIQYAVNEAGPGDTVQVAAGTYTEAVTIPQSITLKGAQAGVDARTRTSGNETIIQEPSGDTYAVNVEASNVTIDGFTIDGSAGTDQTRGIYISGSSTADFSLTDTIIENTNVAVEAVGLDVSGFSATQNLFTNNNRDATGNDGIYLAGASGSDVTISDNTFENSDSSSIDSAAIQTEGTLTTPLSNVTITGNSSTNDDTLLVIYNVSGGTIENNTASNEAGDAILVGMATSGLTIKDNTLQNSAGGILFSNEFPTGFPPTTTVAVTNNTITGMSIGGIRIYSGAIDSSVTFNQNSITNNTIGLDNESQVTVDATNNWWGCTTASASCPSVNGPADVLPILTADPNTTSVGGNTQPPTTTATLTDTGENTLAIDAVACVLLLLALTVKFRGKLARAHYRLRRPTTN